MLDHQLHNLHMMSVTEMDEIMTRRKCTNIKGIRVRSAILLRRFIDGDPLPAGIEQGNSDACRILKFIL